MRSTSYKTPGFFPCRGTGPPGLRTVHRLFCLVPLSMASVSADYDPLNDDEERQVISPQRKVTLPKVQIAVLMVAYFAQPVAITIIYPFIPKLVIDLHLVDGDTSKVGYYSGLFDALPLLSEAIAVLYWTRFSDIYGRRRVLLCGAAGLACSLTCFGLSRTLLTIVLSRTLQGAVDANTAMIKTMLGEIADGDEAVMARLFSFIPIVWASGSTLACVIYLSSGWY
ncbi:hypothetical protein EUX98_g5492 [Antrodiella citrinella]|uniref:Major facilitator superfamily (MFS) profile domain-containing protein n=1 Tax=Antrodiella citrinella TaxID=2447956 RepID=A0A4S4MRM8_9APHY|nr:hypothetical protein EUX98_g5492 [Antrodiella citrinella]